MAYKGTNQRQSNVHDGARRERIDRNQITDLIINGKLVTTHTKAKRIQKKIEKLITISKNDTVNSRRQVAKILRNAKDEKGKTAINKLFNDISPKYLKRNGGYTRVLKFGNRKGDATPISIITFL